MQKKATIAINTVLLYVRMFLIMSINLYSIRLLINELGSVDYGLFNVLAGIASMAGIFSVAISNSTLRFFSFEIGKGDAHRLNKVYSATINICILLSLVIVIITEFGGEWLINGKLTIPVERITASRVLFHFTIFSFISTILIIPLQTLIIANEKINFFAIITMIECILKLFAAISLCYIGFDKLIAYGFELAVVSLIVFILYYIYSKRVEHKCNYILSTEKKIYKELSSFYGWSMFSSGAAICVNQGITILINIFFGPIVNTARAVSQQISNAVIQLSTSFVTAIRPPMIKCYAEKDYSTLNFLFSVANKFIFYLLMIIEIPLFLHMDDVLFIWLNNYDVNMVLFSRLILIYTIIMCLNDPITIIIQSSGRIKNYYLCSEIPNILSLPITYVLLKLGCDAYVAILVLIGCISAAHIIRLLFLKKEYPLFSIKEYILSFILPALFIMICTFTVISVFSTIFKLSLWSGLLVSCLLSVITTILGVYIVALNKEERESVKNIIMRTVKKS